MYYVGTEGDGGLPEAMSDSDHSPAIDWGVLGFGQSHSGRRTRSLSAGGTPELAGEGERGRNRTQSGRQLARRSAVCAAAGAGWLRVLPEADGRMRSAAAAVSPTTRGPKPWSRSAGRKAQGTAQEEKEGECAAVRPARRAISHDRDRPDPDRRD